MADTQQGTSTNSNAQVKGFSNLVRTMTNDKIGVALWATRLMTVVFGMFGYILPIFGGLLGGDAVSCYYKTFMASAATSALRLHQRMPRYVIETILTYVVFPFGTFVHFLITEFSSIETFWSTWCWKTLRITSCFHWSSFSHHRPYH